MVEATRPCLRSRVCDTASTTPCNYFNNLLLPQRAVATHPLAMVAAVQLAVLRSQRWQQRGTHKCRVTSSVNVGERNGRSMQDSTHVRTSLEARHADTASTV